MCLLFVVWIMCVEYYCIQLANVMQKILTF
jgi:hypothetical protein